MEFPVRMTYATAAVLAALAAGIEYGFDIAAATGLRRGTVYPILRRLEEVDMVEGRWEAHEASRQEGRPPRRYYELTSAGDAMAEAAVERFPAIAGALDPAVRRAARP